MSWASTVDGDGRSKIWKVNSIIIGIREKLVGLANGFQFGPGTRWVSEEWVAGLFLRS